MTRPLALLLAALLIGAAPLAAQDAPLPLPRSIDLAPDPATVEITAQLRPGLRRTTDLPDRALRQARQDMLADAPVSEDSLRALAEAGDGLAAMKLAKVLIDREGAAPADLAYYGSLALVTGRGGWLVRRVVAALRTLDPADVPPERVALYSEVLTGYAKAGNGLAIEALVDLSGDGRLLGPLSAEGRAILVAASDASGDGRLRFRMALSLLQIQPPTPERTAAARADLAAAAQQGDMALRTMATTLLARLGPASP